MKYLGVLEVYYFGGYFFTDVDQVYDLLLALHNLLEGTNIAAAYELPVVIEPHEVGGMQFRVESVLVKEKPHGDHV